MPRNYRYKKPRLSMSSPVPAIYGMRSWIDALNMMSKDVPKRIPIGRTLFLQFLAEKLKASVSQNAPDIKLGSEDYPYAKDLRLALVSGGKLNEMVAVYLEGETKELEGPENGKALYFVATQGSPEWVQVLMVYGPWPDYMLPIKPGPNQAKVITRQARPDELKGLEDRIRKVQGKIKSELRSAGSPEPNFDPNDNASGVVVQEDIGYNVLRKEFSLDGEKGMAHWRPAIKDMKSNIPEAMKKYMLFLKTGRVGIFGLEETAGQIAAAKLKKTAKFAETLAPFVR